MTSRVKAATCAVLASAGLQAQAVRVSGATSLRYIELRPYQLDSVPVAMTAGSALLRQLADGRVVRCVPGESYCRDVRPGPVASTFPVMHDVEVSAWGFGEGVRLNAQVRARTTLGANRDLWPQAAEAFDVLALYGELARTRWRLRAGRQWKVSGIGFYNFDGLAAEYRRAESSVEVYGGRSLIRGLNESRTGGAMESIESLSLPNAGILLGVHARSRRSHRLALSAQYQVDVRGDRRGLYSELAAADGVLQIGRGSAEGSLEVDVASGALNQARLQLRWPVAGKLAAFAEGRRYRPYFELWTIWGAFSPVGFQEASGGVTWADTRGAWIVRGEGSYRAYENARADDAIDPLRHSGWGVGGNVHWSPNETWRMDAAYRLDAGFGAARRDAHAGVTRDFGNAGSLAVQGLLFERLYEFRLDEGTVYALGAEARMPVGERMRIMGSATAFWHANASASAQNWTQTRASIRVEWTVGREPASIPRPSALR